MATKDNALRKQLIKEGILCTVVLALLTGGGLLLSSYDDDAQTEKQSKESENTGFQAQENSIQQEMASGKEVSAFFHVYTKSHSDDLVPKREAATQWMTALREANHLSNLSFTIPPLSDAKADFIQLKSGSLVKSDVHLEYGATTDNSAYGFIESLQRKLPGLVVVTDLKLTRKGDLSRETLLDLSQHRITPLVTGELSFQWLGLHPMDEDKVADTPTPVLRGPVGHGAR